MSSNIAEVQRAGRATIARLAGLVADADSLDALCDALNDLRDELNGLPSSDFFYRNIEQALELRGVSLCDLDTFGGEHPADTLGIFSWDGERLLVDAGGGRFRIEDRPLDGERLERDAADTVDQFIAATDPDEWDAEGLDNYARNGDFPGYSSDHVETIIARALSMLPAAIAAARTEQEAATTATATTTQPDDVTLFVSLHRENMCRRYGLSDEDFAAVAAAAEYAAGAVAEPHGWTLFFRTPDRPACARLPNSLHSISVRLNGVDWTTGDEGALTAREGAICERLRKAVETAIESFLPPGARARRHWAA